MMRGSGDETFVPNNSAFNSHSKSSSRRSVSAPVQFLSASGSNWMNHIASITVPGKVGLRASCTASSLTKSGSGGGPDSGSNIVGGLSIPDAMDTSVPSRLVLSTTPTMRTVTLAGACGETPILTSSPTPTPYNSKAFSLTTASMTGPSGPSSTVGLAFAPESILKYDSLFVRFLMIAADGTSPVGACGVPASIQRLWVLMMRSLPP